ncbi:hypothetical protein QJQ45_010275 [Haematococcus lacustris]|nr:hypothetical protein QJQ45_010275 [Haematococcus lacustris]
MAWDSVESKVLAVQTLAVSRPGEDMLGSEGVVAEVALLFVSPDHGVLLQEYQPLDGTGAKSLIAIQAPHLVVNKPALLPLSGQSAAASASNIARVLMRGFAGMQVGPGPGPSGEGDHATKTALLDFSYHLATGNMDEAFRAIKVV